MRKRPRTLPVALFAVLLTLPPVAAQQANGLSDLLRRADAALTAGRVEDAIELLNQANKAAGGRCPTCYRRLAEAELKRGNVREALKNGDKALAAAADDGERAQAQSLRGQVLLALAAREPGRLKDAEAAFRAAIAVNPREPVFRARLGLVLLREERDAEGIQELKAYLASGPDRANAALAEEWIADPRRARENFAPEFSLVTLQGDTVTLTGRAGKVVVLDFWATWCPPCVESVPELKDLQKQYPPEKLVVISVSADENEQAWRQFVARKKMDWPQYRDRDRKIADLFQVRAYPTYMIIDGEGIIRGRIEGLNPQQSVAFRLRDQLRPLLQTNK